MERESTKLCGACLKRKKQRPAQSFCVECNAFQCVECGENHKCISAIEHHKLLGLEEAETFTTCSFNLGKAEFCSVHAEESLMKCTTALAEVTIQHVIPISECKVKMSDIVSIGKRENMKDPSYAGAAVLPDGRLVATDFYNQLCCLLDNDYNVLAEVKLPSYTGDMTVIGQSEVVVVLPHINQLQRVSITGTGLKLNGTIPCRRDPMCVSTISDTELVVAWDQGLSIIDINGTEQLYMNKDSTGRQITFCEDSRLLVDTVSARLYQSSPGDNAVHGMEMTGKAVFIYNNNLSSPVGLALDRDRNIYVCSYDTSSVHQISPDGHGIRIINVGFDQPYTVFFDHTGTQMTVMQYFYSKKAVKVTFEPAK